MTNWCPHQLRYFLPGKSQSLIKADLLDFLLLLFAIQQMSVFISSGWSYQAQLFIPLESTTGYPVSAQISRNVFCFNFITSIP